MGKLIERSSLLERLSRIQRSISHGAPLTDVFAGIAAGAAELVGDPVAGVRLVDEDDPTTMILVAAIGLTPDQVDEVRLGIVGEGAGGRAILDNEVVVVEDYCSTGKGIPRFGEFGVQNAMAAPIRVNGRVTGSLTVASFEAGRRYDEAEREVLLALAEHAGLALLDASLIDQRERSIERRGEERFQALVRHASELIVIVDEQGCVAFATASVGEALGLLTDDLLGTTLLAHVHPGDRPRASLVLRAAARMPGTQPPSDWRIIPRGGHFQPRRWMHVEVRATNLIEHPSVGGIVLNVRDVTERVVAEQRRRDQDALYRQIVDTTHDGVWMTDKHDQTVFVNDALARMLGRPAEEMLGARPEEFMDPDQAAVAQAATERRRRGLSDRYEVVLRRADGSPMHMTISGTPMFEDGQFNGSLALCGDVTELVAAQDEKAELEERLRHAQELELLGRLAGHVAHDFNQVLAVVLGYADVLRPAITDQRAREDLARITEAADHGAALARQLLMFSRRDEGDPEVLDLAEVTRATVRLVAATAPRGVRVEALAPKALPVTIDPTKLRQLLMNLIDNAFDALSEGGELVLSARASGSGHALLTVTDTGTGMPPEVAARALEPAFSTKPSGSGTGLGLAIAHGVVQSAGGSIVLRSAPGRGTTIEVLLPLADTPAAPSAAATAPALDNVTMRRSARILLVEDDAAVLALTGRVLAEHGYTVVSAADPARALNAAREHEIDMLLTDQTLPGGTGLELTEKVREIRPGIPAVVMSGYVAEAGSARPHGVAWLQKPFGAAGLLGSVREALEPA